MIEETATAKYLPSAFSSKLIGLLKRIGLLYQVLVIIFSTGKGINHNFLRLDAFLKEEIDSLIMEGNLNRNSIVAVSDDLVVLAW